MPGAYYNEIDPFAAEWLRRLIIFGHVAPGEVDERSIEDVTPDDLRGYSQHHFFAGIGVWSKALRDAGWSDDRPVWTGSCPCQPFSAAGKGLGFSDERHLWPAWGWLIGQCRPDVVLGEQVESPAGWSWLDLVSADVEGEGYAFGAVGFPAAGVGAPEGRHRLYWLAHANDAQRGTGQPARYIGFGEAARRLQGHSDASERGAHGVGQADTDEGRCVEQPKRDSWPLAGPGAPPRRSDALRRSADGRLGDTGGEGSGWHAGTILGEEGSGASARGRVGRVADEPFAASSNGVALGDTGCAGLQDGEPANLRGAGRRQEGRAASKSGQDGVALGDTGCEQPPGRPGAAPDGDRRRRTGFVEGHEPSPPGLVNDFWSGAEWVRCDDPDGPKFRPVEPGTFPLAHGAPARVGRLRGYGNALVKPQAQAFIETVMEAL